MKYVFMLLCCVLVNQSFSQKVISYQQELTKILTDRTKLNMAYQKSDSLQKTTIIANSSQLVFNQLIDVVFPAWYGTEWDYNGYSNVPQKGQVACGYFVSTTLKHIGFNLNRYKVAQQYSHSIVNTLCSDVQMIRNNNTDQLFNYIKSNPNQLYIIGLDNHVGFISKEYSGIYFIHSSYLYPATVIKERAVSAEALIGSNLFVLGHFSNNDKILKAWLKNEFINIKK